MSTAATADAADAKPAKKGLSKKLIIIIAAVLAVLLVGGGAVAFFVMKHQAAAAAEEGADGETSAEDGAPAKAKRAEKKKEHAGPPTFVPLEPFVVNLADPDEDHYLQVGLTFELADPHEADVVKSYMPAIRNAILLVLAHKTSAELLEQQGKEKLAEEIRLQAARAMGVEVAAPEPDDEAAADGGDEAPKKKKKKKAPEGEPNPIVHVHYSNFIIQ